MYLRAKKRIKDGKEHRYWSIVESCRNLDGRVVQRQVLYLGEINDSQKAAWWRTIEVLQVDSSAKQMALFPADRPAPELECEVVQVKLNELRLHHPRQWGACWLALTLWEQLELDRFWRDRLPASRQGTKWLEVLKTQVCYQLIDPSAVNGVCIATGRHIAPCATCWGVRFACCPMTPCTDAWTSCWPTNAPSSRFFATLGGVVPGALRCVAL